MINPEIIGSLAAILTTAAYVPQMLKVLRTKNTQGLSLFMYIILTLGIMAWFVYAWMINSPSMIWANGITLIMTTVILITKLKHG